MSFQEMPPELERYVQGRMMEQEAKVMSIDSLIDGLDLETGLALADLLGAIGDTGNPTAGLAYFEGMVRGRIAGKYNVCALHGVNHEEMQMDALKGSLFPGDPAGGENVTKEEMAREELAIDIERDLARYGVGFCRDIVDDEVADLGKLWTDEPVTCLACAYRYPSLADRMIKGPNECPGCQVKAGHG